MTERPKVPRRPKIGVGGDQRLSYEALDRYGYEMRRYADALERELAALRADRERLAEADRAVVALANRYGIATGHGDTIGDMVEHMMEQMDGTRKRLDWPDMQANARAKESRYVVGNPRAARRGDPEGEE